MQKRTVPTASAIRIVLRRCGRYATTRIASRHVAHVGAGIVSTGV
jgi:hypothetical protein